MFTDPHYNNTAFISSVFASHHDTCLVTVVSGGEAGELDVREVVGEISVKEGCLQPAVLTSKIMLVMVNEK